PSIDWFSRPFVGPTANQRRVTGRVCTRDGGYEVLLDLLDQARAFVDEPGIELNQSRPGLDLCQRSLRTVDTTDADERNATASELINASEHDGRAVKQRPPGQSSGLLRNRCVD